jgi:hypothetical protein
VTAALPDRMAEAAARWLASLEPAQRAKAAFGFPDDAERTRWYYTPTERGGLPLAEMGPTQQRLAHRLVASGLSEGGSAATTWPSTTPWPPAAGSRPARCSWGPTRP